MGIAESPWDSGDAFTRYEFADLRPRTSSAPLDAVKVFTEGTVLNHVSFHDLNLIEPLQRALQTEGYSHATPIQVAAIPHLRAGRDLVGCAQTGTGKTAAFALPILQRLDQN